MEMNRSHYRGLALMSVLSFVAMYAMVDDLENVYSNINQVYMAGLVAAPMVIIELVVMKAMYPAKRTNGAILIVEGQQAEMSQMRAKLGALGG